MPFVPIRTRAMGSLGADHSCRVMLKVVASRDMKSAAKASHPLPITGLWVTSSTTTHASENARPGVHFMAAHRPRVSEDATPPVSQLLRARFAYNRHSPTVLQCSWVQDEQE